MKILLYSYVFYPSVGGVETVSQILADGFIKQGQQCIVVTETPSNDHSQFPFEVVRNPSKKNRTELVIWADIILFNGASLALQPQILFNRKHFIWIHVGYQVSCIDGLGWVEGYPAPLKPIPSFFFHLKLSGFQFAISEGLKLAVRRFFAKHLVSKNIAITQWVSQELMLPNQMVIYNPFNLEQFKFPKNTPSENFDFVYAGRLVSEKGVGTLIKAFAEIKKIINYKCRLLIIGDGNKRASYEALTKSLGLQTNVVFVGRKTGQELVDLIYSAPIAIVPSEWNEPMGGVALELLSAGRVLIVSEHGGLKECVGEAGITFENGNHFDLAKKMILVHSDFELRNILISHQNDSLRPFSPEKLINQYIDLMKGILQKKKVNS